VCLSLCTRILWAVGERFIRKGMTDMLGAWVDDRLIYAGNDGEGAPEPMELSDAREGRAGGQHGEVL
jgi:hypothetical protein